MSHVCSHWRVVALQCSRLWTRIRPDGRHFLFSTLVRRSGRQTIDVDLTVPSDPCGYSLTSADIAHMRLNTVISSTGRWSSLTIHCERYSPYFWNMALSALCAEPCRSTRAPALEALSLIYPCNDDSKEYFLFGGNAPRLQHVIACGIRLKWTPSLFANLTTLDYTHHRFNGGREAAFEVLSMLHVSHMQLKYLAIMFPSRTTESAADDDWFVAEMPLIKLPALKKLTVCANGNRAPEAELVTLVSHLAYPSLQILELATSSRTAIVGRSVIRAVARVFYGHGMIRSVGIGSGWSNEQDISDLLRSLTNLRHVRAL